MAEDGEGLVAVAEADVGDADEDAVGAGVGVGEEGDVVGSGGVCWLLFVLFLFFFEGESWWKRYYVWREGIFFRG